MIFSSLQGPTNPAFLFQKGCRIWHDRGGELVPETREIKGAVLGRPPYLGDSRRLERAMAVRSKKQQHGTSL